MLLNLGTGSVMVEQLVVVGSISRLSALGNRIMNLFTIAHDANRRASGESCAAHMQLANCTKTITAKDTSLSDFTDPSVSRSIIAQ